STLLAEECHGVSEELGKGLVVGHVIASLILGLDLEGGGGGDDTSPDGGTRYCLARGRPNPRGVKMNDHQTRAQELRSVPMESGERVLTTGLLARDASCKLIMSGRV